MSNTDIFSRILADAAAACNVAVEDITADCAEGHTARLLSVLVGARVMVGWTHTKLGQCLNRPACAVKPLLREAKRRFRHDYDFKLWAIELHKAVSLAAGDHRTHLSGRRREPAKPRPYQRPEPIGNPDDWGFSRHTTNRSYLEQQNMAFAKAMRAAGFKEAASE